MHVACKALACYLHTTYNPLICHIQNNYIWRKWYKSLPSDRNIQVGPRRGFPHESNSRAPFSWCLGHAGSDFGHGLPDVCWLLWYFWRAWFWLVVLIILNMEQPGWTCSSSRKCIPSTFFMMSWPCRVRFRARFAWFLRCLSSFC